MLTGEHLRILLLDDEPLIGTIFEAILQRKSHFVIGPFVNKNQALEAIRTTSIDFAVLDFNLGDDNSLDVADALLDRRVPFLFLSGYEQISLPERFAHVKVVGKQVQHDAFLQEIYVSSD